MSGPEMQPEGPAAQVLATLAAVEPLLFSDFYRRARFYRGVPRPAQPAVVLDLTTECPFQCSFCFASATQGRRRQLSLQQIIDLETELHGVPTLTLIGGEPLAHPEFGAIMRALGPHHEHIEIYTNGVVVPSAPAKRIRWLRDRFSGLAARVTLVLAVDEFHRQEYGDIQFSRKIADFLSAEREEWPVAVRWNVTAQGLHTSGYLTVEQTARAVAAIDPQLAPLLRRSVADRSIERIFAFNPVVQMGRAADTPGESLRAEDAVFAPQWVISPRDDGALTVTSMVPAAWLDQPPPGLLRGHWRLAGDLLPLSLAFTQQRLGLADDPRTEAAFAALLDARRQGCWQQRGAEEAARTLGLTVWAARLRRWPQEWPTWCDATAQKLLAVCRPPGPGWELTADRRIRRLPATVLRRFIALFLHQNAEQVSPFVADVVAIATSSVSLGCLPMWVGYRPRPGLLNDVPDEPVPLRLAPLDQGVDTPHLGDALIRPQLAPGLHVGPDGRLTLTLDGLGAAPVMAEGAADVAQAACYLWGALRYFVPPNHWAQFDAAVLAGLSVANASVAVFAQELGPAIVEDIALLRPGDAAKLLGGEAAIDVAALVPDVACGSGAYPG